MLSNLSVKKLLSIALSIVWIDLAASQTCTQHPNCLKILCPFCFYGLVPVIAAWILYWLYLEIGKEKAGTAKEGCQDTDIPRPG